MRVPHEVVQPSEQEVRLLAIGALERLALARLERFQTAAMIPGVCTPDRLNGKKEAVVAIALDRIFRQYLWHRLLPQAYDSAGKTALFHLCPFILLVKSPFAARVNPARLGVHSRRLRCRRQS